MTRRARLVLLVAAAASCRGGCDANAVFVVEEVGKLASVVDTADLLQDLDGDGAFSDDERTFVVDPRGTVDKALRFRFLVPIAKAAFDDPASFIELRGPFPGLPADVVVEIEGTSFEIDPADPTRATAVAFDLVDDLGTRSFAAPITVTLHLDQLGVSGVRGDAHLVFVVAAAPPAPGTMPARILRFDPAPRDLPGWSRPIALADRLPGEGYAELLARLEAANFVGATLDERLRPHQRLMLTFSQPMANFVVSIDPEDGVGVRLKSQTPLPFLEPFDAVISETGAGLAPDTVYLVSALSRPTLSNVPAVSGTQDIAGLHLMPNLADDLYAALRAEGLSDADLHGDSVYEFRTGPVRITGPVHLGATNRASGTPAGSGQMLVLATVQHAAPADGAPDVATLDVCLSTSGCTSVLYTPVPDTIAQGDVFRTAGVTRTTFDLALPAEDFDGRIDLAVTARTAAGEFAGDDAITFSHDVIVPWIDSEPTQLVNDEQDGELDRLCVVADCDVAQFVLEADGGAPVTLTALDTEPCTDGRREYCFSDVSLGLVDEGYGTVTFTLTAIDDAGNPSVPVTLSRSAECQAPEDRFVATGGMLLRTVVRPDGTPGVAWLSDSRRSIRYAEWTGTRWLDRTLHTLPPGSTGITTGYGLGFDMILDARDGRPTACVVEGRYGLEDSDLSATGSLVVLQRADSGAWNEIGRSPNADVRPIGCSLAAWGDQLVVAYNVVIPDERTHAVWGRFFGTNVIPIQTIANDVAWDLSVKAQGERLYFAFREPPPEFPLVPRIGLPGPIAIGFFERQPDTTYTKFVSRLEDPAHTGLGAAPSFVLSETTIEVVYLSASTFSDNSVGPLSYLRAPLPAAGEGLAFEHVLDGPRPLSDLAEDGISTGFGDDLAVFYSAPRVALSLDGTKTHVVYVTMGTDDEPGEEVVMFTVFLDGREPAKAVLDGAIGSVPTGPPRSEAIPVDVAEGPRGYQVAYRNGLAAQTGETVIATWEPVTAVLGGENLTSRCGNVFRPLIVTEAQLNLTHLDWPESGTLWDPACYPIPFIGALFSPWRVFDEIVGDEPTLVGAIVRGVVLKDGRSLLKPQSHVCVPDAQLASSLDVCDSPNEGGTLDPSSTREEAPAVAATEETAPITRATLFGSVMEADAACPASGQVYKAQPDHDTVLCIECPTGFAFDPEEGQCVRCPEGSFLLYPSTQTIGAVLRFLFVTDRVLECRTCESETAGLDPQRAPQEALIGPTGAICSRCAHGSRPLSCTTDDDCSVLNSVSDRTYEYRCSAGNVDWRDQESAPEGNVCLRRCDSSNGCYPGTSCSNGVCVGAAGGAESPSPDLLACRPIGCDVCWNNLFCLGDEDCPYNHTCSDDERHLTPLCIARPIFDIPGLRDLQLDDPDAQHALDEARAQIAELRKRIEDALKSTRLPDEWVLNSDRAFFQSIDQFSTELQELRLSIEGSSDPMRQGYIVARFTFDHTSVHARGVFTGSVLVVDPWTMELVFQPFVRPLPADTDTHPDDYRALGFHLVETRATIKVVAPGVLVGVDLGDKLQPTLQPIADELLHTFLDIVGWPADDTGASLPRCMFVSSDPNDRTNVPALCLAGNVEDVHAIKAREGAMQISVERCQ